VENRINLIRILPSDGWMERTEH